MAQSPLLDTLLATPGVGYFREFQEKQQQGIRLAIDFAHASHEHSQALLEIAKESLQDFQKQLKNHKTPPQSFRAVYDEWVK